MDTSDRVTARSSNQTDDPCLFAEADALYATMKENLTSPELGAKTGAEVERQLAAEQQELMRRLFQAHLTLRGPTGVKGNGASSRRFSALWSSNERDTLAGTFRPSTLWTRV